MCPEITVTGDACTVVAFHNLTLHGTYYNNDSDPRISLRYLLKKNQKLKKQTKFDMSNRKYLGK